MSQTLVELARVAPAVRLMTEEFRLQCLATGCEPTCHFCDKPIPLGTPFGFRRLGEARIVSGISVPGTSAMGCGACVENATPEQIAHARGDATARLAPVEKLIQPVTPAPPRVHPGCFINDNGEIS